MSGRRPGTPGIAFGLGVVAAFACATARPPTKAEGMPGLVFPAHFAEGEEQDAGATDAEPAAAPEPAKRSSSPPDPEPLRQAEQYEYAFAHESGATRVVSVRAMRFQQPVVTARKMGRFALELWVGTELIERVRFDFPLLAAEEPPTQRRPLNQPPSLAGGVLKATVLLPASVRARRAVLVDRGTNVETELDWPPKLAGAAPDAGTPVDAGTAPSVAPPDGGATTDGGSAKADGGKR